MFGPAIKTGSTLQTMGFRLTSVFLAVQTLCRIATNSITRADSHRRVSISRVRRLATPAIASLSAIKPSQTFLPLHQTFHRASQSRIPKSSPEHAHSCPSCTPFERCAEQAGGTPQIPIAPRCGPTPKDINEISASLRSFPKRSVNFCRSKSWKLPNAKSQDISAWVWTVVRGALENQQRPLEI